MFRSMPAPDSSVSRTNHGPKITSSVMITSCILQLLESEPFNSCDTVCHTDIPRFHPMYIISEPQRNPDLRTVQVEIARTVLYTAPTL